MWGNSCPTGHPGLLGGRALAVFIIPVFQSNAKTNIFPLLLDALEEEEKGRVTLMNIKIS